MTVTIEINVPGITSFYIGVMLDECDRIIKKTVEDYRNKDAHPDIVEHKLLIGTIHINLAK